LSLCWLDMSAGRVCWVPCSRVCKPSWVICRKILVSIISERLDLSVAQVYGVASFYTQFYFEPRGRNVIKVCIGTACHIRGAPAILERLKRREDLRVLRERLGLKKAKGEEKPVIRVCCGTGCTAAGGPEVAEAFSAEIERQGLAVEHVASSVKSGGAAGVCTHWACALIGCKKWKPLYSRCPKYMPIIMYWL